MTTPTVPAAATAAAPAPVPGSPEHQAAMVTKFENQSGATTPATDPATVADPARPAWLPEKFKTPEDFAAAYKALETKLHTPATPAAPAAAAPAAAPATPAAAAPAAAPARAIPEGEAAAAVTAAGLDMAALSTEFATSGALSEASLAKLAAAGIAKPMVDAYIAGQTAIAQQYDATLYTEAGGKETYEQMVDWAAKSLTPAEKVEFNAQVNSMDEAKGKLAIAALKSRYVAANGQDPVLQGGSQTNGGVQAYASRAEMTTDMKDPRYKNDPAFRNKVYARLNVTEGFANN